jgi:phosphoglycolate phosphatase
MNEKREGSKQKAVGNKDTDVAANCFLPSAFSVSSLRILLWDIDGTLMRSARRDAFKDYTVPMFLSVFGTAGRLPEMSVSGMTDLQIVIEALRDEGFTSDEVRERIEDLKVHYMHEMERATRNESNLFYRLPGAREVLEATRAHPRYKNALLTGNIEPAARLKMRLVGLSAFFDSPGAFGDESHDRRDLPALAAARINAHLNLDLQPSQFIVIGDTPNDIACAKHFGAKAVAVATGRMYSPEDLLACSPDALLLDLSDVGLVMETFAKM